MYCDSGTLTHSLYKQEDSSSRICTCLMLSYLWLGQICDDADRCLTVLEGLIINSEMCTHMLSKSFVHTCFVKTCRP